MIRKVKDYKIVVGQDPIEAVERANTLIKEGFEPHGSLIVQRYVNNNNLYYQPMIKYKYEKENE